MPDKTGIEWTDATWNPIIGCSRVSEGCRHCYAETQAARIVSMDRAAGRDSMYEQVVRMDDEGNPRPLWNGEVRLLKDRLDQPLRWARPRRIFVNSMSDLFHESIPDEWIDRIFAVMALAPQHTFQILTKRPERMLAYMRSRGTIPEIPSLGGPPEPARHDAPTADRVLAATIYYWLKAHRTSMPKSISWPLPNVWLGFSAEDQVTFDERWEPMQHVAEMGWLVWCSAEPLLGEIELPDSALGECLDCDALIWEHCYEEGPFYHDAPLLSWVVVGGESGKSARPMHPDWARSLRDQCVAAEVSFLFKQWGEWCPVADVDICDKALDISIHHPRYYALPDGHGMLRIGKHRAGRTLDGCEWNEYPEVEG